MTGAGISTGEMVPAAGALHPGRGRRLAFIPVIREPLTDLLQGDRALTVRTRRGSPLLRVDLRAGLAVGAAAVLLAPRATAAAAVAAMFRGITLTVDRVRPDASTSEAA